MEKLKYILSNNNLLIYFFACILIFSKVIFSFNQGYTAPDSEWFFKIAEKIYLNKSLFYSGILNMPGYDVEPYYENIRFVANWPPLYPICIVLIKSISGLSFFWSSKIINIICSFVIIYFINKKFNNNILTIFVISNATIIEVSCFSLTEYLFITLLFLSHENFYSYIKNKKFVNLILFFIISNLVFFTRYNGIYIQLVFLIYLSFLLIQKRKIDLHHFLVFVSIVISIFISLFYFSLLLKFTGHITGIERGARDVIWPEFIYIIKSLVVELNYVISDPFNSLKIPRDAILLEISVVIILLLCQFIPLLNLRNKIKFRLAKTGIEYDYFGLYFCSIIIYFLSINYVIIFSLVDHLYYRSMSPITIMSLILISNLVFCINEKNIKEKIDKYILYLITLSILINVFMPIGIYLIL